MQGFHPGNATQPGLSRLTAWLAASDSELRSGHDWPLFLLQGESDVITLTTLATEYFAEVEAPQYVSQHSRRNGPSNRDAKGLFAAQPAKRSRSSDPLSRIGS